MSIVLKKVIFLPLEFEKGKKIRNKMKMRYFKGLLAGVIVTLLSFQASSQTLELGVFGGGSYYIGDMNTALPFVKTNLAYGALARYNLNKRWSFKFGYNRGEVKGDDTENAFIDGNGLNFQTKVNDFSLVAEFNFFDYFTGSKKTYFTPYIFAGLGFLPLIRNLTMERHCNRLVPKGKMKALPNVHPTTNLEFLFRLE